MFAGVFPEDKIQLVRAFQRRGAVVGMSGDGVNDAPALRQAEAGVAVANATDVAKAAAAMVLTRPGLGGVVPAIETSRRVFQRIITYTLAMLVKKIEMMALLVIGFLVTRPHAAHAAADGADPVPQRFSHHVDLDRPDGVLAAARTAGTRAAFSWRPVALAACKLVFSLGVFLVRALRAPAGHARICRR